ncbi:MAG TPA: MltA domain-containing protein [Stellaceae bacterium]
MDADGHGERLNLSVRSGGSRFAFWGGLALVAAAVAAGLIFYLTRPPPPARLTLRPSGYDQLAEWAEDNTAATIPAFLRSCAAFQRAADDAALAPRVKDMDFGSIREWRMPCADAAKLPADDDAAARRFFEAGFTPLLAGNNGAAEGLFTGYYEITLRGARKRGGPYQVPIYRRPADSKRFSRAEVEDGALAGQGLELLWVDDPIDAFFLEIQGSGLVHLKEGGMIRIGYDGSNGHAYVPVGRLLLERGEIPREQLTAQAIRAWMKAHPKEGAALRRENPSYVFFREISGDGPLGAQRVPLTAGRSLAVDRAFIPFGAPIWLEAQERFSNGAYRRLVIAQDTGGAIRGPVRGDLFWGHGKEAADGAGAMNARGRYYLLLPRSLATRLSPIVAAD